MVKEVNEMTKKEKTELKRFAKEALAAYNIKIPMTNMIVLECSSHKEIIFNDEITVIDYVMFEDKKTETEYQCYWGANYYNHDLDTLYSVSII